MMDITTIANTASSMSRSRTQDAISTTVLKKSMDIARQSASAILSSVSSPSSGTAYPVANIGQQINTTA